jgi:hypothetical protein
MPVAQAMRSGASPGGHDFRVSTVLSSMRFILRKNETARAALHGSNT